MYDITEKYVQRKYDIKKNWNEFEIIGVRKFANDFLWSEFDFDSEPILNMSQSDGDTMKLNVQDKSLMYGEVGVYISHFLLVNDDILLMICHDEEGNEKAYKLN